MVANFALTCTWYPYFCCFWVDICTLPKDTGPCKEYFERWYYNQESGFCEQFIYGGCQGNKNQFESEAECRHGCNAQPPVGKSCIHSLSSWNPFLHTLWLMSGGGGRRDLRPNTCTLTYMDNFWKPTQNLDLISASSVMEAQMFAKVWE